MLSTSLITIALVGTTKAFTPPGFEPVSSANLTVAFGNTLAIDGVDLPKSDTQSAPTVGTSERLVGTYAIMMVDPDIPSQVSGGPTGELLHWMQGGLVSANTSTTIGGVKVFELTNPTNTRALAAYIGPAPPARSPTTHRYTQLLLRTDNNTAAVSILAQAGLTRQNFSAVNVVKSAGLTVLAGNWFNVTNSNRSGTGGGSGAGNGTGSTVGTNGTSGGNSGNGGSSGSGGSSSNGTSSPLTSTRTIIGSSPTGSAGSSNGSPTSSSGEPRTTTNVGTRTGDGAFIAILGALAAAVVML